MAAFLPPDLLSGLAPPAAGREPPRAHPIGGASGRPPRRPWHNSFARRPFVAQYLRNPRREFPAGSRPPDAPPEMLLAPRFPRGVRLRWAGDFPWQEALSSRCLDRLGPRGRRSGCRRSVFPVTTCSMQCKRTWRVAIACVGAGNYGMNAFEPDASGWGRTVVARGCAYHCNVTLPPQTTCYFEVRFREFILYLGRPGFGFLALLN